MNGFVARIGIMRLVLAALVAASFPLVLAQEVQFSAMWQIAVRQVAPAVVLMVFWAIPLDVLMAKIYMAEREEVVRRRYRSIIRFDLALMGIMVFVWGPFFFRLLWV